MRVEHRLYDGLAVGALSVLVSEHIWSVGLPFGCLVPWRRMAFTLREQPFETEEGARRELLALDKCVICSLVHGGGWRGV